jgi:hypothetical protein
VSGERRARAWGKQRQNIDASRFVEVLLVIAADLAKATEQGEQGLKERQKDGD